MSEQVTFGAGLATAGNVVSVVDRAPAKFAILSPTFRPDVGYGAKCDGAIDDTAAWKALIADLTAKGYGDVDLPSGTSLCQPGVIKLPSNASIRGKGAQSEIMWAGGVVQGSFLIDASGASPTTFCDNVALSDFKLSGGPTGGQSYLIRAFYARYLHLSAIFGDSASAGFLQAVQLWDSRLDNLQLTYCGTSAESSSILIANSLAASGFGYSGDTSNQIFMDGVRSESFYGSALAITQGVNNGQPPNGIYVSRFKAESGQLTTAPLILIGAGTTDSSFRDIYLAADGWSAGDQPIDAILDQSGGGNIFEGIRGYAGQDKILNSVLNVQSGAAEVIRDVYHIQGGASGGTASKGVVLIGAGAAIPLVDGLITSNTGMARVVSAPVPLVINLAEDAYQGDAQVSIALDGVTITPNLTVTASNAAGAVQAFSAGNIDPTVAHTVVVEFLNDDYGGSDALDRNAYVRGYAIGGTTVPLDIKLPTSGSMATVTIPAA